MCVARIRVGTQSKSIELLSAQTSSVSAELALTAFRLRAFNYLSDFRCAVPEIVLRHQHIFNVYEDLESTFQSFINRLKTNVRLI